MKKHVCPVVIVALVLLTLSGCGQPAAEITGRWDMGENTEIEFNTDSTYTVRWIGETVEQGEFAVSGNDIRIFAGSNNGQETIWRAGDDGITDNNGKIITRISD